MGANEKHLTTSEVAKRLGVSEHTIYNHVKKGDLIPVNKDNWHLEGGFIFSESEIEKVRHRYIKPDLSTQDVANRLGVSITTVLRYIKEGQLLSYQRMYKGKVRHFVKNDDLQNFIMQHYQDKKKKNVFHSKTSRFFLFQPFRHKDTNELARIIEFNGSYDGKAVSEEEKQFDYLLRLEREGYEPIFQLKYGKQSTKRGYAKFEFPFPKQIKSTVYKVIEMVYKVAGPQNMKLETTENTIRLQVKPTLFPLDKTENIDEIDLLKNHITEGKVLVRPNGVLVESDLESIHAYVPSALKEEVKKLAEAEEKTIEDIVTEFIEEGIKNRFAPSDGSDLEGEVENE
ncbi:transposase [Evansella vedderi]|uniref:Transposase n=1 Tax=Evansella vedderi TaxID=38282 RepID=A0ABT9ZWN1_9BACI|nr:helix-turn-helix domain-containing protein [Evansella vedderi]MDQ0255629.1 transposase [Evansella vedderi]